MRPLTSDDPRTIGEYRTLVRLGAGGMGVVYLARSSGGALAAVKVIRAEHAADPGFRARFRRESEAAGRVTGPWAVPVTGADTEAREPWLATAFVPGPSLAEAVAAEGPLPATTVRVLGARLAGALVAVHEAGLVHRDVKPGNVLLALDGPRLIDFGIARHEGATALTATDVVIGTPGYLAPEQASARPLGPACDIFSLGCVLVYAATGRRPFGQGTAAGVLFRTVHEEPDLDGLPSGLLPLVEACLAKDPADRPTARQVEELLTDAAPPDARSWAPPGLSALIAERSATALALPVPEPPTVVADPGPPGPSRRRVLTATATGAVLLTGGAAAALVAGRQRDRATSPRTLPTYTIGLHADLSGPGRAVGLAHERGIRLAVDDHNSRTDAGFRLALRTEDDAGDAARALHVANRLVADPDVLAVVGPTGDVAAAAVVSRYETARLAQVVVAAGSTTADSAGTKTLCVTRPFDDSLSIALIRYVVQVRPAERVVVVEDRADLRSSWSITDRFRDHPIEGIEVTVHTVDADTTTFAPAAHAAVAARADAVVYAGSSPGRGARCATALADAGFTGTGMSVGPVLAPAFLRGAGKAAEGWVFAQAYTDPTALPAAKAFTAAHRERFGAPPGRWSAEAYDAVGLTVRAARTTSAAEAERGGVAQRLFRTSHPGITRTLSFHSSTRQVRIETGMFLYRVQGGRARFLGPYTKV
ncbi:bifunctional serine/threonine-protein kinase/ABC transporter substrate-binding protein [Streptomyces sp. NBC_01591]|uniref:bifunctional serine/threonine-protein kinase/ABC transporter substrate-binding protein n=1 Tax=Streptomyces sp. NBC_01591 TaxID=2975888 RepID=UPI002DDB3195|nr:bifunctional serine/threonine-protein kinase/ABC transporter substrate-binding protein [Streptomyces sp. NBC_01591]WSD71535.1 bifunctional serine/threonine-protein kinase/ABC transporter substrate-binding protein [Streptomyces sp. NBC_01591]